MQTVREKRTLFGIRLSDPRERRAVAGERARAAPRWAGSSSDVVRGRVLALGGLCAALATGVAAYFLPASAPAAGGALALPHRKAKLECSACHVPEKPAAKACVGCHGAHPSARAGHARLQASGELGCVACHDVHGDDGGVRFVPASDEAKAIVWRYGVAGELAIEDAPLYAKAATVPLVPLSRCARCHDGGAASDPIQRCLASEARDLGGRAPTLCFDEHRRATDTTPGRSGGVCSEQHGADRYASWEAARAVAIEEPAAPAPSGDTAPAWWWLAAGAGGALVGFTAAGGSAALRRRREAAARKALAVKSTDRVRLPVIDTGTCLGCYACVDACPYDVLAIERYVAVVARPEVCCGLTLCEQVCPNGSLRMSDGAAVGERPAVGEDLQAREAAGIYLAGDVTGLPLIKNAILQGRRAADAVAADLGKERGAELDLLIVGAGPAGISAALRAKELGLRFRVIEQGGVAQSIRSFPRGKLVFDQPLELPAAGKLWLEESTKEELLAKWIRIVRQEKLPIDEATRFVGLTRDGAGFVVRAATAESERSYRSARVLLAIGVRGSPRKLPIELSAEIESKVYYHLADARSLGGQRVLVVGLGDVAMEAAIALSRQPGTEVTISYRGDGFHRGKERNKAELERLVAAGRVTLVWRSTVSAIEPRAVRLRTPTEERRLANDVVLVMIGSVAPTALLAQAGVGRASSAEAGGVEPPRRA